jgi:peptidylprolyl isomerase
MKYFTLQRKATKHLPDLNTLSLKKRMAKNRQRRSIIHPLCRFSRRWTPFDTSIENVAQTYGKFDPARAAQNGYQPIPFQSGKKMA